MFRVTCYSKSAAETADDGYREESEKSRTGGKGDRMELLPGNTEPKANARFYMRYAISALALIAVLFCFTKFANTMSMIAFALVLILLTAIATPTFAYVLFATKLHDRTLLNESGFAAKYTRGKTIRIIMSFVLSVFAMASLLLSVVRWGQSEWMIVVAGAVVCPFVFMLANKIAAYEFKLAFEKTGTLVLGGFLLTAALGIASATVVANTPVLQFDSVLESYLAHENPFGESSSTLLMDAGLVATYTDTVIACLLSQVADASWSGYVCLQVILTICSLGGFVNLLCACMMPDCVLELFLPLVDVGESEQRIQRRKPQAGLVVLAAVLVIAPVAAALWAEGKAAEIESVEGVSQGKQLVQDQIGKAVYMIDGKTYDQEAVEMALGELSGESSQLTDRVQNTLVPLINASFDKRIENIDNYLDWYYSPPADYERVLRVFTGSLEEGLKDQLTTSLTEGIDDSELNDEMQACTEQAAQLQEELKSRLADCEVSNVPDWLMKPAEFDPQRLTDIEKPIEKLMEDSQRITASVGAGALGGFVAKKVVDRIVGEKAFEKMATTLARSIGVKGASSAIGAAAGSVAPVAGNIAGAAAGTAIGIGVDFALLKADEMQNRQSYHDEIAETIEEQRAEVLAALPQPPAGE